MMVNGGTSVNFQIQRIPFLHMLKLVPVPPNEIVVIPNIVMRTAKDSGVAEQTGASDLGSLCQAHSFDTPFPLVVSSWRHQLVGGMAEKTMIWEEMQVLQDSISIPGTDLNLVYSSSQADGYKSKLWIQMTGPVIPKGLLLIRLRIILEGVLTEKIFESEEGLTYTFAWNKRNAYQQKVYGWAVAKVSVGYECENCARLRRLNMYLFFKVSVGYEYENCAEPVWVTQSSRLYGFHMGISNIGNWNLNVHHRYNFHDGKLSVNSCTLQLGDGTIVHLADGSPVVSLAVGSGTRRPLDCPPTDPRCEGKARDIPLLAPTAIAGGRDGNVFLGDFNLIRKIDSQGKVKTIFQLHSSRKSFQYYMAVSPVTGELYISDPEQFVVLRLRNSGEDSDAGGPAMEDHVAGTPKRKCASIDPVKCGDGGPARKAQLQEPRGIAFGGDGTLFLADGSVIRRISPEGMISSIVGKFNNKERKISVPCSGAQPSDQVMLNAPEFLAVSPLDQHLYFTDDSAVFEVTSDGRVRLVMGQASGCSPAPPLKWKIMGMGIKPDGSILLAGRENGRGSFVRMRLSTGEEREVIRLPSCPPCAKGVSTACKVCEESRHKAWQHSPSHLASHVEFASLSALTVAMDGRTMLADDDLLRVFEMTAYIPGADEENNYWIPYPPRHQVYIFSQYGHHMFTKDLITGRIIYSFLYNVNTSYGKLLKVTDASGNKVEFIRDYLYQVNSIETTDGSKYKVQVSRLGTLKTLTLEDDRKIQLGYLGETGLLISCATTGAHHVYEYDSVGRLIEATGPTGNTLRLAKDERSLDGALETTVIGNNLEGGPRQVVRLDRNDIAGISTEEEFSYYMAFARNRSFFYESDKDVRIQGSSSHTFPVVAVALESQVFSVPAWRQIDTGLGLTSRLDFKWEVARNEERDVEKISRGIQLNGVDVLSVEYDRGTRTETWRDGADEAIFSMAFNVSGEIDRILPRSPSKTPASQPLVPITFIRDPVGRVVKWQWGKMERRLTRDPRGRITEVVGPLGIQPTVFEYGHLGNQPLSVTLPSGRKYKFIYDATQGLRTIVSPSRAVHRFFLEPSLGFFRFGYSPPGVSEYFMDYYDDFGRITARALPGNGGQEILRFDQANRLKHRVHGGGKVSFEYQRGLLARVLQEERDMESVTKFGYRGGLLEDIKIDFSARSSLSDAKFSYEWGEGFELQRISGRIGGQRIPEVVFSYDRITGALDRIGDFAVHRSANGSITYTDGSATITVTGDSYGREVQRVIRIRNRVVLEVNTRYAPSTNQIAEADIRNMNAALGAPQKSSTNYTYDPDGQLVNVDSRDNWRFTYDKGGNLASLHLKDTAVNMEIKDDRLAKFGQGQYKYDVRGFVVENAARDLFHYDGRGLLVLATHPGRHEIKLEYDHLRRLISRKDSLGNITQFFYTDPRHPQRLTHIFQPRENKLMSLTHDYEGRVLSVNVDRRKYYLQTDHCGTPLKVFNSNGELVREITRSPYGKIMWDTNSRFTLPIDFCGGILEPLTEFIHMSNGRIYDPVIGQWMTPNWREALQFIQEPARFHVYRFNGNDPVNYDRELTPPKDRREVLSFLGYNINRLIQSDVPLLNLAWDPEEIRNPLISDFISGAVPMSGLEKEFEQTSLGLSQLRDGSHFSLTSKSTGQPKDEWQPKVTLLKSPLGEGVLVSRSTEERTVVRGSIGASEIHLDVFTSILNETFFLDLVTTAPGPSQSSPFPVFHFVKPSLIPFSDDLKQLKRLGRDVRVTSDRKNKEHPTADLSVTTERLMLLIHYGLQTTEEVSHYKHKMVKSARRAGSQEAWEHERRALKAGLTTQGISHKWSEKEIDEILRNGQISAYDFGFLQDPKEFPELIQDPFNVKFHRKRSKG
ncbi:unnamed protein product [Cyprideis torosa]|uniref:Tox-GHH domain-containing protein n=1 Tax=Cyprideis torosa TaxID=163714 RepID=A0A7R8ZJ65_9CRUS|nr:unnamed protein product [Cyprideis torosa]CAG0887914.1 unnamed protein product [Cyprideis torosa]